jgi:hypothetical protein
MSTSPNGRMPETEQRVRSALRKGEDGSKMNRGKTRQTGRQAGDGLDASDGCAFVEVTGEATRGDSFLFRHCDGSIRSFE